MYELVIASKMYSQCARLNHMPGSSSCLVWSLLSIKSIDYPAYDESVSH